MDFKPAILQLIPGKHLHFQNFFSKRKLCPFRLCTPLCIGAMACAIAGTWRGIEAIPAEWIQTLEEVNSQYDFRGIAHGLTELARKRKL